MEAHTKTSCMWWFVDRKADQAQGDLSKYIVRRCGSLAQGRLGLGL